MGIQLHCARQGVTAQTITSGPHRLTSDMSVAEGGADEGPSPHDLYDAALGACKALTVMWYARKKGIAVDDVRTEVTADKTLERAGVYRLNAKLVISGSFTDAEFAQLRAAAEKCPVHKLMTQVTTEVTTSVERVP